MAKMVIEKIQRLVDGNTREPQRKLREFDGHRINVHAVNAGFDHPTTPVRYLSSFLRNAGRHWNSATRKNFIAARTSRTMRHNLLRHRARSGMPHDVIGKPFNRADKEVPATHCWIDEIEP